MTIIRTKAQEMAMRILHETLAAIRADALLRASCWRSGDDLFVAGSRFNLAAFQRVIVLGAGKASAAMARALERLLTGIECSGFVVTKYGHAWEPGRIQVFEAGHPLPDENSLIAGERMMQVARTATCRDLVIVLLSGGASALVEVLRGDITLEELRGLTEALLRSGADIEETNTVRSCLSQLKAGGLARAVGESTLICVLLSDVIGNRRDLIGSGPCWGGEVSPKAAEAVLARRSIRPPESVKRVLREPRTEHPVFPEHVVIGDVYTLLEESVKAAQRLGMRPKVYGRTFSGEARVVGASIAAEALALQRQQDYDCVIAAGETTVTVRGAGLGGRNQELACAAALALAGQPNIAVLAVGTDGTDGPTDAAGGLVDGETQARCDLRAALADNDCYHALESAGALVVTGPTQTNLNDLVIVTRLDGEVSGSGQT